MHRYTVIIYLHYLISVLLLNTKAKLKKKDGNSAVFTVVAEEYEETMDKKM